MTALESVEGSLKLGFPGIKSRRWTIGAILSEFLVGDDPVNCLTRGFVCFWFVLRAGIPELLTRAFFWGLALGHLNVLHLKEASFNLFGFADF